MASPHVGIIGAICLLAFCVAADENHTVSPTFLPEHSLGKCLDGTPGAYYLVRAPHWSRNLSTWVFHFQGGGWCDSEESCLARSRMNYGTSTQLKNKTVSGFDGTLSRNCTHNPAFCDVNLVYLPYCDGWSFMGSRIAPLNVTTKLAKIEGGANTTKQLFLRGRYIREAVMQSVLDTTSISSTARAVLISGCSAGGLATYLHSSSMHTWAKKNLPHVQTIAALPLSGFFLAHSNVEGVPVYPNKLTGRWFDISNATADADPNCLADLPSHLHSRCMLAEVVFSFQRSVPTFVLNSQMDYWQSLAILMGNMSAATGNMTWTYTKYNAFPEYRGCIENFLNQSHHRPCKSYAPFLGYQQAFLARYSTVQGFHRPGSGAFIDSCFTHCQNSGSSFWKTQVDGITASQAVTGWWNALIAANNGQGGPLQPALQNTFLDCVRDNGRANCNPTCNSGWGRNSGFDEEGTTVVDEQLF